MSFGSAFSETRQQTYFPQDVFCVACLTRRCLCSCIRKQLSPFGQKTFVVQTLIVLKERVSEFQKWQCTRTGQQCSRTWYVKDTTRDLWYLVLRRRHCDIRLTESFSTKSPLAFFGVWWWKRQVYLFVLQVGAALVSDTSTLGGGVIRSVENAQKTLLCVRVAWLRIT